MRIFLTRLGKGFALALFICAFLMAGLFLVLKRGVSVDQYRLGNITFKQCHLRLEKKLHVTFGDIVVSPKQKGPGAEFDPSSLRNAMEYVDLVAKYFDAIIIKKITIGDTVAAFALNGDGSGHLTIDNPAFSLAATLAHSKSLLTFKVEQFKSSTYRSHGSGTVKMDLDRKTFTGDIKLDVAQTLPLQLHLTGDGYQLNFEGKGNAPVRTIRPVVELFDLGPDIQPWITDALKGGAFNLDVIKGTIPFAGPENVFHTLYGKVSVQDCEYTFEPKLPSIKARSCDVVFENGVLKIFPHQPRFAGIDAGRSWLDIDFNTDNPILTAFITTETELGDRILALLDFYDIHLPFKQTGGVTDAELTLSINLANLRVSADGIFKVADGTFVYQQQVVSVTDSTVLISDDNVTIKEMNIGYQDTAKLKVEGKMDFGSNKSELNISVEKFDLPWQGKRLSLDLSTRKVLLHYHRDGDIETFTAPESDWKIGVVPARMEGFTTSLKADDLSGTLTGIHIDILPYTHVLLSGDFNLKKPTVNLVADFQGWESDKVKLDQQHLPLKLSYTKGLEISSERETDWLIKGKKLVMSPFILKYGEKKLAIDKLGLKLEAFLTCSLHGIFDISTGKGSFVLDQLEVDNPDRDYPYFSGSNLSGELATNGGTISATIPDLGLSYQRNKASGWVVHVEELGKLYDRSRYLQKYNLNQGSIDIWEAENAPLMFSGSITYPYDFLVKNNIPLNEFDFKGQYEKGNLDATINNDLHLRYSDRIQISSSGIGYNYSALRTYLEDHLGKDGDKSDDDIPDFDLQADKTSLYLNPYQSAPADRLQIHSENGKLTGQLKYGKGKAELQMNNVNFTLLGQDFGEKFLDGILKDSQFIGGKLSFYVSGLLTKFKGVVKIENSVVKNGVVLNNIMAFISTVPDLITFSLPGYSLQGIPFNQLYAGFLYDNHTIDVTTFAIESNALDMTGTGKINLVKNSIDMNIDLISKTKKYVSKIPLLGYLLVGDTKQPTVTLNVEGKLNDPDVSTSVYKEIVKTPFDILLRTISLPSHIFEQLEGAGRNSSDSGKESKEDKSP
jgi:AsmA-like C-terminal region/Protein of unknown function